MSFESVFTLLMIVLVFCLLGCKLEVRYLPDGVSVAFVADVDLNFMLEVVSSVLPHLLPQRVDPDGVAPLAVVPKVLLERSISSSTTTTSNTYESSYESSTESTTESTTESSTESSETGIPLWEWDPDVCRCIEFYLHLPFTGNKMK